MTGWKTPRLTVGSGEGCPDPRTGTMAHRKGLLSGRVAVLLGVLVLLAVLLAGRVLVLNQMTAMRANIAALEDRKGFLETESASLLAAWNRETAASVICRRARLELNLIRKSEPGLVLVKRQVPRENGRWGWPEWLGNLAAGDDAQAAKPVTMHPEGQMISLIPFTRSASADQGGRP